jgi:hypothetical protein
MHLLCSFFLPCYVLWYPGVLIKLIYVLSMADLSDSDDERKPPGRPIFKKRFEYRDHMVPSAKVIKDNRGIPHEDVLTDAFNNEHVAVCYFIESGVLPEPICETCGLAMTCVGRDDKPYNYRCRTCRTPTSDNTRSLFKYTILGFSKLPKSKLLRMMYLWCIGSSSTQIVRMTRITHKVVSTWVKYFRQLVSQMIFDSEKTMIGGPGTIVEIDESKFGKCKMCKNRKGKRVVGAWVFGGVMRTPKGQSNPFFAVVVRDRSAATLLPLIKA